jgi:DNA-binding IclR family transcriptional regulator
MRLRDIAATFGITERSAFGIVDDLVAAGYLERQREGRRNRYMIRHDLPLAEPAAHERTIGQLVELLAGDSAVARRGSSRRS